ncbi:DNA -binding domain-containing protein [Mesorhizobium abyssinicae]|uniref:DNA -binding domain-containing protein n=1 Tax=Mesorhizobium abyssinicae TaxID=1209958 RepID=UPI00387DC2AC
MKARCRWNSNHANRRIKTEVPWSDNLTAYDREHFTTYMQFLDAGADNASYEEMAEHILGIDPELERERARRAARSHLDRANWMMTIGYKELFSG